MARDRGGCWNAVELPVQWMLMCCAAKMIWGVNLPCISIHCLVSLHFCSRTLNRKHCDICPCGATFLCIHLHWPKYRFCGLKMSVSPSDLYCCNCTDILTITLFNAATFTDNDKSIVASLCLCVYVLTACYLIKLGLSLCYGRMNWEDWLCNAFNLFRNVEGKGMKCIGEGSADLIGEMEGWGKGENWAGWNIGCEWIYVFLSVAFSTADWWGLERLCLKGTGL